MSTVDWYSYEVKDNVVTIYVPKDGDFFDVQIDLEDLQKCIGLKMYIKPYKGLRYCEILLKGNRSCHKLHRYLLSSPKGLVVDHIDGNGLNNSKQNLRQCTQKENCQNQMSDYARTLSGCRGITWYVQYGKWRVRVGQKLLGYFEDFEVAKQVLADYRVATQPFSKEAMGVDGRLEKSAG